MGDVLADMIRPLKRYATFRGRARRREYWLFILLSWSVFLAVAGIGMLLGWHPLTANGEWKIAPTEGATLLDRVMFGIFMVMVIPLIVPTIALQVRRFHDSGRSAWSLLWYLVPYIGEIAIFILMLWRGTPATNQYGLDPINPCDEWGQPLDAQGRVVNGWRSR